MLSQTLTGLHVKYPLFLLDVNAALIFSRFPKNLQISSLTHIQWKPKRYMRTDGRAGGHVTTLMIAFRNFVNAPNKSKNNMAHAVISEIKSIPQRGK